MGSFRFTMIPLVFFPAVILAVLAGGAWPALAVTAVVLIHLVGDNVLPKDRRIGGHTATALLDGLLFLHIPMTLTLLLALVWQASSGDLFGLGVMVNRWLGFELARHHAGIGTLVTAALATGFMLSTNTIVGHELVHRTRTPWVVEIGRFLLMMIGDAQFAIAHVFGHHLNVGTLRDPATARRGESLYTFIFRSGWGQIREAAQLEHARLRRLGRNPVSLENRFLIGSIGSLGFAALAFALAGGTGLAAYFGAVAYSKFLFETVNYIQHYGLVRAPGTPVQPRHSWDCTNRVCSTAFYHLPRHSAHHAEANIPFWDLEPKHDAMDMSKGYIAAMCLAMVPPLWKRIVGQQLTRWDAEMASPVERTLVPVSR